MLMNDLTNEYFQLAVQFVNHTSQHLFLTGKAGTGKTTFLKYIKENTHKKLAVVAPTGVAAINAGGVTIHSLFQLPFGPFIPTRSNSRENSARGISDQHSIFNNLKLTNAKRELLQELELLIIDEVSMVRADLLDAIDIVLRHFRRQPHVLFGGVQMLYIGDLFQLPPVVSNEEWQILGNYYKSPFFFDAQALIKMPPVYMELKKIYRQSDVDFIRVLNNIRNNQAQVEDLELLHKYYRPGFRPENGGEFITLTTHNSKAETINQTELEKLEGGVHRFEGIIKGEFNERALPAENILLLKVGAQIMFLKNDKGEERRYYNGKIGSITRIEEEKIFIVFPGGTEEMMLEKETWTNIRYQYNKEKDIVEEEELGTFTQYPVRLAWAITIHKSQGLTFNKAIVDAGDSFAAGQVYVALSRLTSLEGMVLYSRIQPSAISTDHRVLAFTQTELAADLLHQQLKQEQRVYISQSLLQAFDWSKLLVGFEAHWEDFEHRQIPLQNESEELIHGLVEQVQKQNDVAMKFSRQLDQLLPLAEQNGFVQVNDRVKAASEYFLKSLHDDIFAPLVAHYEDMKNRAKVKKYLKETHLLIMQLKRKKTQIEQAVLIAEGLMKGVDTDRLLEQVTAQKKEVIEELVEEVNQQKSTKAPKGESHRISLALFKEGKTILEIASERSMAVGTVEGHLQSFLATGEIEIKELITDEKLEAIKIVLAELGEVSATEIKERLGDDYTFGEIRAVRSFMKMSEGKATLS